ncbi:tripartite tricarboxylate transporter substrate binding protein [Sporomusa aerivorans]|uniref:tripartite tricarboxylate transporter substrate binding protein n=1 Tax=Sporomusa aerivorans TaxID=204936 RepID=UPI00352B0F40
MNAKRIFLVLLVSLLVMTTILVGCGMGTKESTTAVKYPTKPITIIAPAAAGGTTDTIARLLEKAAPQYLGQPFIVVNKPGGAATIGMNELASASPDGYTIGIVPVSVMLQPLYGPTRYHYPSALDPLAKVATAPATIATLANQPWKNINDLVVYAKQHPGEVKFGHAGLGSSSHIAGEMFARETGINIVQVPFKGDAESLTALLGGHIQLIITGTPAPLKEYSKNGTIRFLGVVEEKRLTIPGLENIPTLKEQGINIALSFWNGIGAPKGLPAAEKKRLADELEKMINNPSFKKDMADIGMSVEYLGPDKFSDQWIADNAKLSKIVKETGIAELIANQKQ